MNVDRWDKLKINDFLFFKLTNCNCFPKDTFFFHTHPSYTVTKKSSVHEIRENKLKIHSIGKEALVWSTAEFPAI